MGELRNQLTTVSPADREQFEVSLAAAPLHQFPAVVAEYRRVWALRTRPEMAAAVNAELVGTVATVALGPGNMSG